MNNYLDRQWKVKSCPQGDLCWCRMIVPIDADEDDIVITSGTINAEVANHIVSIHNNALGYVDK